MKRTFAFGAATAQGAWPVQEDGYFLDPMGGLFGISDGFGGRGAGDLAAKTALAELRALSGSEEPEALKAIFAKTHEAIKNRNQSRAPAARGGASLVAAFVNLSQQLFIAQCGACAALLVRNGRIRPLLLPQCPPREEFQVALPEQALGLGNSVSAESRHLAFEPGDILVLASSGLEWESEPFQVELLSQLSVRGRGEDLGPAAAHVVENGSLSSQSWNRTLLLIERL